MFEGTSESNDELLELDIVKHYINTTFYERRAEDEVETKGMELLVIKAKPIPSSIGKRKRSYQVIVKKSSSGSYLSREEKLEFLNNQEVLGGKTFDLVVINMEKMREFLKMMKIQNWEHLFAFGMSHVYKKEVKVVYYKLEISSDGLYLKS